MLTMVKCILYETCNLDLSLKPAHTCYFITCMHYLFQRVDSNFDYHAPCSHRLHSIGRVPLPHTILCLCIHVLKLAYLLPTPSLSSPFSVMSNAGLFLSGIAVLRTNTLPPPIKLKPVRIT